MRLLTQVCQRESWDCGIAAIATVLETNYETVYATAHELFGEAIKQGTTHRQEFAIFKKLGFDSLQYIQFAPDDSISWVVGRTYLATVPSANGNIHTTHRIVIQNTPEKLVILDSVRDDFFSYKHIDIIKNPVTLLDIVEVCYAD